MTTNQKEGRTSDAPPPKFASVTRKVQSQNNTKSIVSTTQLNYVPVKMVVHICGEFLQDVVGDPHILTANTSHCDSGEDS